MQLVEGESVTSARMGRYFGIAAIDLAVREEYGRMISYKNGRITSVPLEASIKKPHLVDIETQYDTDRYNGRRTILNKAKSKKGGI